MIEIQEGLKSGDIVYVWISPYKEKNTKKHDLTEFKLGRFDNDGIQLISTGKEGYSLTYSKFLIDSWFGNIKKAK